MTSVTDPLGNTVEYVYDTATGRLLNEFDAKGNDTSYTYDTLGRTIEVVSDSFTTADDHLLTPYVSYAYNNDDLWVVGWHGNAYHFTYDGFGNKQSAALDDHTLITYTYGINNGNLGTVTYGNGAAFLYTYDEFDRVTKVRYIAPESTVISDIYTYLYRKDGSLAQMCDIEQNKTYKYFYDLSDRLVKVVVSDGTYYMYTYDANNNLIKVEEGNGTDKNVTEYTYDLDNRETQTKTGDKTYTTTYDSLGRITKLSWDTTEAFETNLTYNSGADGSQSAQLGSISNDGDVISYTYDANGNIVTITDSAGTTKYYYDEMDQMYREDNHLTDQTVVYVYDAAGNILSKKIYAKTDAATISGAPTDTIVYGYTSEWADQMTSYDGQTVTYDSIGNPLNYLGKTLTWTKGRQLSGISDSSMNYSYSYDVDGIRTQKKNNTTNAVTTYQLDGDVIAAQTTKNASNTVTEQMTFTYDSSGSVIAMTYNGTQYFYKKNGQGDIIGIVDATGTVVVNYSYDSWGKLLSVTGNTELGNANPFRYRGYYYDVETGWYYLNSRYYNPEVGRFISADTVTDGGSGVIGNNLFIYGANNPVNNLDPSGNGIIKSAVKWLTKNVVNPVVKKVQRTTAKLNLTYSTGVSVNGAAGIVYANAQIGVSLDTKGNVGIQTGYGYGATTGSVGVSVTRYKTVTNAHEIDNLLGGGGQVGGAVAIPLHPSISGALGRDINIVPHPKHKIPFLGMTASNGFGVGPSVNLGIPFYEGHIGVGYTMPVGVTINVYELWDNAYAKIMEW